MSMPTKTATLAAPIVLAAVLVAACGEPRRETGELTAPSIWRGHPENRLTSEEIDAEIAVKDDRVQRFLRDRQLAGILLTQVRNVRWMTAGVANTQIVLNKDVGAASLLILDDGGKYLICNGSEAGRLMDEELGRLGYRLEVYPWYAANPVRDVRGEIIARLAQGGRVASDVPFPGTEPLDEAFKRLRYTLTDGEIKRYRWLGRQTAEAVAAVCRRLRPGMNEYAIEAMTAAELRARGILPTVLLVGVDERIARYRHCLPAGAVLERYAMVNVVAEKWGMPVAVTRFVHFGPLDEELESKLLTTAIVNAHYLHATRPGKATAEIFEEARGWYAEAGYPDEWQLHHQGGAIGYDDREYVIYPDIAETVRERQAFAWNPTITGAKIEDTILVHADRVEVVTVNENWPLIHVTLDGVTYPQPGILIKDPAGTRELETPDVAWP